MRSIGLTCSLRHFGTCAFSILRATKTRSNLQSIQVPCLESNCYGLQLAPTLSPYQHPSGESPARYCRPKYNDISRRSDELEQELTSLERSVNSHSINRSGIRPTTMEKVPLVSGTTVLETNYLINVSRIRWQSTEQSPKAS